MICEHTNLGYKQEIKEIIGSEKILLTALTMRCLDCNKELREPIKKEIFYDYCGYNYFNIDCESVILTKDSTLCNNCTENLVFNDDKTSITLKSDPLQENSNKV